jgi:hypothetical protein
MMGVRKSESNIFAFVLFSYSKLLHEAWGTLIRTSSQGVNMITTYLIWSRQHQHAEGEDKTMITGTMADEGRWEVQEQHFLLLYYSCRRLPRETRETYIRTSSLGVNMIITHLIWSRQHQHSDEEEKTIKIGTKADDGSRGV